MTANKICPHIIDWNEDVLEFIRLAQPDFAKVMVPQGHNLMNLSKAKQLSPRTKWICRLYRNEQPLDRPSYQAGVHAGLMTPYWEHYDIFEDYNEPPPHGPDDWKRVNEFGMAFGRCVHEKGKKYCAFNWSNGQPPLKAWAYLKEAYKEADYIGIHSYGWPTLRGCEGLALRHRLVPGVDGIRRPIILTEFGFTYLVENPQGKDVGWKTWGINPEAAKRYKCIDELAWMADRLAEDPYVLAACYFVTGRLKGDQWNSHDLVPAIYKKIARYVAQPKNDQGGGSMDENIIKALDVSAWGGEIKESQWKAAYDAGFRLAIVQAWGGIPGGRGKNKHCRQQLGAARKAGLMTAIYFHLPSDTTTQTHLFIPVVKEAAGPEYEYVKFVAVDIESDKDVQLHPTNPKQRLGTAISNIEDKPIVIYTSLGMWPKLMGGNVTGFEQYPLWDARYDEKAELDTNWVPYGGWNRRAMKQYKGTTTIAGGISADLNVVDLRRLNCTNNASDREEAIQDALKDLAAAKLNLQAAKVAIDIAEKRIGIAEEKLLQ